GMEPERFPSLLAAMDAATGTAAVPAAPTIGREQLDRLRGQIERLERRRRRLTAELEGAEAEAVTLRRQGDLLLSQLHLARKGMAKVEVSDFKGGTLEIELDPALSPYDNAQRLYDAAKKRERAAARLPALIEEARAERDRLAELLGRAEAGSATPEEVDAVLGPPVVARAERRGAAQVVLPYRRY